MSDDMTSLHLRRVRAPRAVMVDTVLAPWGGTQLCIDAYEAGIRTASDLHMNVARTVALEPVRSAAATIAGLTRDVGATRYPSRAGSSTVKVKSGTAAALDGRTRLYWESTGSGDRYY